MPLDLHELIELMEHFGYKISAPRMRKKTSVVDALLGAFEGVLPEGRSSTEYLKELRESGYGRHKDLPRH